MTTTALQPVTDAVRTIRPAQVLRRRRRGRRRRPRRGPGRGGRAARPQRRRQDDDHRDAARACASRTAATVRVFGLDPRDAVRAGPRRRDAAVRRTARRPHGRRDRCTSSRRCTPRRSPSRGPSSSRASPTSPSARSTTLSGGQRQRVLFALAVVPDPDLVVLDEPTVAMDVETRRAFWAAMRVLTGDGRSVLFATHYLEEADANADRIVLLARGTGGRRRSGDPDQGRRSTSAASVAPSPSADTRPARPAPRRAQLSTYTATP